MKRYLVWIIGWILLCGAAGPLDADVLWRSQSDQPLYGRLIRAQADRIEFQYWESDKPRTIEVDRENVVDLIVTVDPKVLESLRPNDLRKYLDYAEELSSFHSDVYARRTAQRLSLIVAKWGTKEQKRSAFRLLVSLCDGAKRRQVQRLAFMYDETFEIQRQAEEVVQWNRESILTLIEIVQLIRRNEQKEAKEMLEIVNVMDQIRPIMESRSHICSLDALRAAAQTERLSGEQLTQLVQLEQSLLSGQIRRDEDAGRPSTNWWATSQRVLAGELDLPEFETVLPFDPGMTVFRNGRWVSPDQLPANQR